MARADILVEGIMAHCDHAHELEALREHPIAVPPTATSVDHRAGATRKLPRGNKAAQRSPTDECAASRHYHRRVVIVVFTLKVRVRVRVCVRACARTFTQ